MGLDDLGPDRASQTPRSSFSTRSPFLRSRSVHLDIEDPPKHLNEQALPARWRRGVGFFSWPTGGRPRVRSLLALVILFALSVVFWTSSWPTQTLHLHSSTSLG
jgi:hypothetical protein